MLIDTHAHLFWDSFQGDFDEVIQRSLDAGVEIIINVGVDPKLSKIAADLKSDKIRFYSTIGIHPHEAVKYFNDTDVSIHQDIKKIEDIYQKHSQKVVAIGECGLDYFFDPTFLPSDLSPVQLKKLQQKLFQKQIDLAKKINLPLLIHCRDDRSRDSQNSEAWDDVLDMIGNHQTILHCYSGLFQTTLKVLKMPNVYVSFAATITYPKNEYLRQAVQILPLEKIVLETDCPFLPPQSKRGARNEPANIVEIAQLIAEIKRKSFEQIANQTTFNAQKVLKLR